MIQARNFLLAGLAAGTLLGTAGAGQAQQAHTMICGQREHVVGTLEARFGEQVRSMGLAPQNRIVEVFVSEETGSWTITVTSADGTTCLMASGQHYESFAPVPAGEPL
ncbi:hypothetical protein [Roseicyclus persicicus]|uniref:Uncharacterized protein n=1 Tax=Roseicyclus persicicus TaxID=2650661 RepID=A0A7X6JYU0_9RHOB|nr:hypothetical protein [Roseibacterium persicicum]NKX44083.1 hypothetical protein [Roseibacterium persicicum]